MKTNQLKVERVLRGWSQARVAEAVGTNVRTVIRWEQGQTLPHPYYREQLCELFGKNARDLGLLEEDEHEAVREDKLSQGSQTLFFAPDFPVIDAAIPATPGIISNLIGRTELLTDLKQQLCAGYKRGLVALQGLPGMGKTSLAIALATDQVLRDYFCDGVLWAGLGQEPDISGQLARWGKLLGVTQGEVGNVNSREAWGKALRNAIGTRRMLLVIDDAWSVEEALALQVGGIHCAHVLTTRLPHIAFAFARENTQVVSELPDEDGLSLLGHMVPHLVEQDPESARALVQAVGGSPLALTLMGNYLASFAFTGQARRLQLALKHVRDTEQRLRLSMPVALADRSTSLPADTPLSLYAAIAVSTQRLSEKEQDALCALAVFPPKPSSFSEEAALTVSMASEETLDLLWDAGLLESSGSGRYSLHQTIADYASSPKKDVAAQMRLVNYMVWYIEEYQLDYEALEQEHNNILAALEHAMSLNMSQELQQSVLTLVPYMRVRGYYTLAHHWLSQALHIVGDDNYGRMHILRHLSAFAELRGEYTQAENYSQEGLQLARQFGMQSDIESALLTTLGLVAYHHGNYVQAKDLFEAGLQLARNLSDRERTCTLLTHLGRVLHYQGDYQQAEQLYHEALSLAQEIQQNELLNHLLIYLGAVHVTLGEQHEAQRYYQEGLILARALGHREHLEAILNDMGIMAYQRGELDQATSYFLEGLSLAREIGHSADCCLLLSNLGAIAIEQGHYARAEVYLHEGIKLARLLDNRNRLTLLLSNLGSAYGQQGHYERANACFRESLELANAIGAPWYIYGALSDWGEIHLKHRQLQAATEAFQEILAQTKSLTGEPELQAGARFGLARIAALQGKISEALHLAQESENQYNALGHHKARAVHEWWQSLQKAATHALIEIAS